MLGTKGLLGTYGVNGDLRGCWGPKGLLELRSRGGPVGSLGTCGVTGDLRGRWGPKGFLETYGIAGDLKGPWEPNLRGRLT